nr:hypothetical protein [Tanacetum cinerariifolium]
MEHKPNVAGSGPSWLFDIDTLTKTMNYQPVTVGNQSNLSAGFQDKFVAKKVGEESDQQYVLFPVWSTGSTNPKNTDRNTAFDEKEPEFEEKKPESKVNVSPSSSAQSKKHDDKTKREAKGKSPINSCCWNRTDCYSYFQIVKVSLCTNIIFIIRISNVFQFWHIRIIRKLRSIYT